MKKSRILVLGLCLALMVFWIWPRDAGGETIILNVETLILAAVDATPLDGSTSARTYLSTDRLALYSATLTEKTDAVEIIAYSTGADTADDTALINIYGYSRNGPAVKIYDACTFTLGTATAPDSGLYAGIASGTDLHSTTVNVSDSVDNGIVKITFDTVGLRYLYFEPETFTGITNFIVQVRSYGFK